MHHLHLFRGLPRRHWLAVLAIVALAGVAAWLDQYVPALLRQVPGAASGGHAALLRLLATIAVLAVAVHALRIGARLLTDFLAGGIEAFLLTAGVRTLVGNTMDWHATRHVGEVQVRLSRSAAAAAAMLKLLLLDVLGPVLVFACTLRVCWQTSPMAAAGMLLMALSIAVITLLQIRSQGGVRVRLNRQREGLGVGVFNAMAGIAQIKLFRTQQHEVGLIAVGAAALAATGFAHHKAMARFDCLKVLVERGGSIGVLALALLSMPQSADQLASAGVLIALLVCIERVLEPLRALHRVVDELCEKQALAKDYLSLREAARAGTAPPRDVASPAIDQAIRLEQLSYTHPGAPGPLLKAVNLTVPRGARVAIVGPTGGGKSTLARLLCGLLAPSAGRILVGGGPLAAIERQGSAQVGMLTQDAHLVPQLSVIDNIRLGRAGAPDADVLRAASSAGVETALLYDGAGQPRMVTARGSGLSGGQQQRISLARVLLQQAPVIVLDEPCSAQDPAHRARLFTEVLPALGLDRTVFVITHDQDRLAWASHVLTVGGGRAQLQPRAHGRLESLANE